MKITLKIEKEFDVRYLRAFCKVRYWEDSTVNGAKDIDGLLIPCADDGFWAPLIDIDVGKILNWKKGVIADIHYKVCDNGTYVLLDEDNEIKTIEGYVPSIMCPGGTGYGDYVIMNVDKEGYIEAWEADLSDFMEDEEQ